MHVCKRAPERIVDEMGLIVYSDFPPIRLRVEIEGRQSFHVTTVKDDQLFQFDERLVVFAEPY